MKRLLNVLLFVALLPGAACAAILTNGGFEAGLAGWKPLWTREANKGSLVIDDQVAHTGARSARITHRGERDWSFESVERVAVQVGEVFELTAWMKVDAGSESDATLCVTTYDARGQAIDWSYSARSVREQANWKRIESRFAIPDGVVAIQPRFIGHGAATMWVDDVSLRRSRDLNVARRADLPRTLTISNTWLEVTLHTSNATLSVLDRRTKERFEQKPLKPEVMVLYGSDSRDEIKFASVHAASGMDFGTTIRLDEQAPEFTIQLSSTGELPTPLQFPHPFTTRSNDYLVVPMNEGISYPVEDKSIEPMRLVAYGGHGICMAFWGVTDGVRGHSAIIESPDDAAIRIARVAGRLAIVPEWDAQRGQFGDARRLRYTFFDRGGHVAIAKRYREHAQKIGLFKSLADKRKENPNVDLLVGAVNVWCWDKDPVGIVKELKRAGIARILWSNAATPEKLRELNDLGVLTSRYDVYQDVMAPTNFPKLRGKHGDWVTEAWPDDIVRKSDGDWLRGWGVKGRDDEWFHCGVICDKRAPGYAAKRISAELGTHPYRCRFIDTTTAAPWHECYNPAHPMTRSESREWKMKLLDYVSREAKLVTGCETGHDASVPFLHYFEGMMSLGPYRVPDSGRDIQRIWTNAPERLVKFQLGHEYRLPLWELVFHDCVVAQWYWGDYNNKLPMLWDKRDLFNVLYGTPPMFMFNRPLWEANSARFLQSYTNVCGLVRDVGYSEMTDHKFLTPDRNVQQTAFANGTTVTVNFGATPFLMSDGRSVAAMSYRLGK